MDYDLLVIGGGINGAGIARDAAGRGQRVVLVEQDDLASHTSSASTKLIHGGLRYLEQYEFRLVRESLEEREVLWAMAPHIIWPMRFVLPVDAGMRPAWLLRLGLWVYDHLGKRRLLPGTKSLDLRRTPEGVPLQDRLVRGFAYSDCWVEDSRLTVLNAVDAAARGATIRNGTRCLAVRRIEGGWEAELGSGGSVTDTVTARMLVNAAGPWVDQVLGLIHPGRNAAHVRLVKGSHIVTRRLYAGEHAYFFQLPDGRIIFAIPYEREFTLIGTTEVRCDTPDGPVAITADEIAYLCEAASRYFAKEVTPGDVVWSYAGVRPLYEDHAAKASVVTRDYVLDLDAPEGHAPALSVFGGKITTYRRLAEAVLDRLAPWTGDAPRWTRGATLPGGDFPATGFDALVADYQRRWPWLPPAMLNRLLRAYGTRVDRLVGDASNFSDLGVDFGAGFTEAEATYLTTHEFARTAGDMIWRRTRIGLHMTDEQRARVQARVGQASP